MKLPGLVDPVAYFCAEFAIDNDLPTYSGGLGILAGDTLNEAAIQHYPIIGLGILYKGKDFMQHISASGKAETRDSEFDHDTSFLRPTSIEGKPLIFKIPLQNYEVLVKSYHIRLSDNTVLFFLSTDVDGNPPEWVSDMDALYRGDTNGQIRQQILLGIGGVKLLEELKITPKIYHINEGRPEFIIWELTRQLMERKNLSFEDAWKAAREKIVYSNHTLVAAGNLTYPIDVMENWATPFAKVLNVDTSLLIKDGISDSQSFNTTLFALNISKKHCAVSRVHATYAKRDWPNFDWISVTNGVNMARWQDSDFRNPSISDQALWDLHMTKKRELVDSVKKRTGFEYDPNKLVIVWARRLAEYKQPKMIFDDITKIKTLLFNPDHPIQLLFAGNTHSADPNSQRLIEEIISIFSKELAGSGIFVPNYNISLANHFVSGSDVWLNTPKGNLEACGTSGMKAAANGVLNCTVLDGWTYEVNWEGAGWVLDASNTAGSFYSKLEAEIAPLYFKRDENGLPLEWISMMRRSIEISRNFSTERMLEEYKKKLYN